VVTNVNVDDSGDGWKLMGGVTFNDYFAAEVAYVDLGDVTASFDATTSDASQMLVDAGNLLPVLGDGFSVSAVGRYPFGERGAIFAKVGAYFWEADVAVDVTGSATGSASPNVDGTDVVFGVGGDVYFSGNFGLRLEWERYALEQNDVDFVSASLLYRFGGSGK
jgi:OOP family OmpA-OmpF porin